MALLRATLILAAVLFVVFQTANALTCTTCIFGDTCNGTLKNETCKEGVKECFSVTDADDKPILKGCDESQKSCDIFKYCSTCSAEACNSSTGLLPSLALITIVSLAIAKRCF